MLGDDKNIRKISPTFAAATVAVTTVANHDIDLRRVIVREYRIPNRVAIFACGKDRQPFSTRLSASSITSSPKAILTEDLLVAAALLQ